jgi:hypothetical protein
LNDSLDELNKFVENWKKRPFRVDQEKLSDVIDGLRKGDISDCMAPSVSHAADLLHIILSTYVIKSDVFEQAISHYAHEVRRYQLQEIEKSLQAFADHHGFGEEFSAVAKASELPKMEGYQEKAVAMIMKSHRVCQNQAINMLAKAAGMEDSDNLRRTVIRQKKRKKKAST